MSARPGRSRARQAGAWARLLLALAVARDAASVVSLVKSFMDTSNSKCS
jgi:hypothetical protein